MHKITNDKREKNMNGLIKIYYVIIQNCIHKKNINKKIIILILTMITDKDERFRSKIMLTMILIRSEVQVVIIYRFEKLD